MEVGLAPKTVGNVMVIPKEMLKHAVQWSYLDANPRATRLNCCTNTESSSRRQASPISILSVCGRSGR